jgi:hypothetical protein
MYLPVQTVQFRTGSKQIEVDSGGKPLISRRFGDLAARLPVADRLAAHRMIANVCWCLPPASARSGFAAPITAEANSVPARLHRDWTSAATRASPFNLIALPDRLHLLLLRIVGISTAPTSMALTCRWRSRPQHQKADIQMPSITQRLSSP